MAQQNCTAAGSAQHCCSAAVEHQALCNSLLTFSNSFLPASSSALYTPGMPSLEMILEMGPVMVSTEFLKASSSLQHRQGAFRWLSTCKAVLLVMSLRHACQRQCCAGCCLLLKHRFTPSWPAHAGPTSALASHISSRGPPQCHARRRAGHSALRRCHFCTRSPVLFLFNCNASSRWLHAKHVRRSWPWRAPGEACRAS